MQFHVFTGDKKALVKHKSMVVVDCGRKMGLLVGGDVYEGAELDIFDMLVQKAFGDELGCEHV